MGGGRIPALTAARQRLDSTGLSGFPPYGGDYSIIATCRSTGVCGVWGFACQCAACFAFLLMFCAGVCGLTMCGHGQGNRAPCAGRSICASFAPLGVYIYAFGGESCTTRHPLLRSARRWPRPWPRLAPSGAGPRRRPLVTHSGEKRGSSRALHPPSASRCFVGGIPPPRLVRAWCRIARTVAVPFPCVRSFRPSTWARPSAAARFCS